MSEAKGDPFPLYVLLTDTCNHLSVRRREGRKGERGPTVKEGERM